MKRRIAAFAFVCALGAAVPPATAETRTRVYAGVALDQLWDSNVMNSRGDDAVTRLQPRLGVLRAGRRLAGGLDYRLALHGYARGTAAGTVNHRAALWGRAAVTRRVALDGDAVVLVADDPVLLDRPAVVVPQGRIFELAAGARVEGRATRRTTLAAGYRLRVTRFDTDGGAGGFDGDQHDAEAGGRWRATRRLDAGLVLRGQRFDSYHDGLDSEHAFGPTAIAAWRATRRLDLAAELGALWFADAAEPTFVGAGRASWRWRGGRVNLEAARRIYGGTGAPAAITSHTLRGGVAVALGRRLALELTGGAYATGLAPHGAVDTSGLVARLELEWLAGRGLSLGVYAEHRAQDAGGGLAFDDIQRTLVGVRLVAVTGADLAALAEVP